MLSVQQLERTWIVVLALLFALIVGGALYDTAYGGTVTKNPDMTYTFHPTPKETIVLEQAEQSWGKDVMLELIQTWVDDTRKHFDREEAKSLKSDLDNLTEADRQKIVDMLKGRRMIR